MFNFTDPLDGWKLTGAFIEGLVSVTGEHSSISSVQFGDRKLGGSMRRVVVAGVAFAVFGLMGVPLGAWGMSGHRIVARVAKAHLPQATTARVSSLLGGQSMADVANWADSVRKTARPDTYNWHFVDIQKDEDDYDPSRDCKASAKGDCIIAALTRLRAQLSDPAVSQVKRAEALRFITHFVGDLHQPLHCADNKDRGGGAVKVFFFGAPTNLHSVWDSGIISRAAMSEQGFANDLLNGIVTNQIDEMQSGSFKDWALEAHALAQKKAYAIPTSKQLGKHYYGDTWETVDIQLTRAGLRLAKVVTDALGS